MSQARTPCPAVIVGACGHGLCVSRSLHAAGIRTILLEANSALPGIRTCSAELRMVEDINGNGLITALLDLAQELGNLQPVLFLTNDHMVRTLAQQWEALEKHYRLSWSTSRKEVLLYLDKLALEERCLVQDIPYPKTVTISGPEDLPGALATLEFPIFAKPVHPLSSFKTAILHNTAELSELLEVHQASLPVLLQQYIPGDDRSIQFCAVYLDRGRILARFDGHKLRSRPLGHTTIAESLICDDVFQDTQRFFEGLRFSGPASLEVKSDEHGRRYVVEPTVGRTDFWLGVCIANGVNFPLLEYSHQVGLPLPPMRQTNEAIWFYEERDPFGLLWFLFQPSLHWSGRRPVFLYLFQHDPAPARLVLKTIAQDLLYSLLRNLPRLHTHVGRLAHTASAGSRRIAPTRVEQAGRAATGPSRTCKEFDRVVKDNGEQSGSGLRAGSATDLSPAQRLTTYSPVLPTELSAQQRERLHQASIENSPFSSLDWFENLFQYGFPAGFIPTFILAGPADEGPLSCLPVISRPKNRGLWLSLPSGERLNRIEALSNYYSPLFAPLLAPGAAQNMANAFIRHVREKAQDTDVIDLRPMDAQSDFFQKTRDALRHQGFWVDQYFCFGNWYLEVQGRSFDEYFRGLPSKIRKNSPRERRRLEEQGLSIKILTGPSADLEWAIQAYEEVYAGSWKRPEPYPDFIPSLCRMAARNAQLRLGILSLKDVPVAAQLWLVKDKSAYIFKLAYVEQYAKQSVGTALTCEMMKYAIDTDKVDIVDYGMGDDAYKKEWMSHRRERHGLIAFNSRSVLGILAAARHFGGNLIKPYLKRFSLALAARKSGVTSK